MVRCLQQGFGSGFFDLRKNDTDLSEPDKVLLSGAVLFAPALKIEQVKKLNGCLLPLAGFGAWATPKLRAAKLVRLHSDSSISPVRLGARRILT